jgi:hypothetical protein
MRRGILSCIPRGGGLPPRMVVGHRLFAPACTTTSHLLIDMQRAKMLRAPHGAGGRAIVVVAGHLLNIYERNCDAHAAIEYHASWRLRGMAHVFHLPNVEQCTRLVVFRIHDRLCSVHTIDRDRFTTKQLYAAQHTQWKDRVKIVI